MTAERRDSQRDSNVTAPGNGVPRRGGVRRLDLLAVCAAFLGICLAAFVADRRHNHGTFSYIIDDPYIHLAMAKNLVAHGVWGVTPFEFSSASSSPFWVVLLATGLLLPGIASVAVYMPLLLNIAIAVWTLYLSDQWLRRAHLSRTVHVAMLLAIIVFGPLLTVVFIGMEHVLHTLLWLAFLNAAGDLLAKDGMLDDRRLLAQAVGIAAAMVLVRFEALFAIAALGLLLVLRRRYRDALALGLAGLPLAAFALWSITQGGALLPNSVLMKGKTPPLSIGKLLAFATSSIYKELIEATDLLVIFCLVVIGIFAAKDASADSRIKPVAWLWVVTTVLHLQFARVGWYFRYETYLVVSGLLVATVLWSPILAERARRPPIEWLSGTVRMERIVLVAVSLFTLAQPFFRRGFTISRKIPSLASDAYRGNWQVGRFLAQEYAGRRVALNDIGAPTYLADFELTDLWGLGTLDVTRAVRMDQFGTAWAEAYCRRKHIEIAILNSAFLHAVIRNAPPSWQLVRTWHIETTDGPNVLHFFATSDATAKELAHKLARFEPSLPPGTIPSAVTTDPAPGRLPLPAASADTRCSTTPASFVVGQPAPPGSGTGPCQAGR